MSEYVNWEYSQLQAECKERGLGGKGKRDDLINKLVADDMGQDVPPDPKPEVKKEHKGLKPTDPNPDNPNFDMAGRWIRR